MMAKAQERITTLATPAFQNKIRDARYLVGENRFAVTLDSGKEYVFSRSRLECDDGTDVVMVAVDWQRFFFHVTQASGNKYEIPWDRVLYECEASYPYFRKHGTRVESPQGLRKQIIRLRKAKGMTQRELARASRMLRPNLSRIEAGKHRPTLDTLQKIANALSVSLVDLILRK